MGLTYLHGLKTGTLNTTSPGFLINTFEELETFGLHYLLDQAVKGSIPTVYPVDPVLELNNKIKENEHDFATDHIKELAIGLERSGYPFLWTLPKKVTSVEGVEKHVDDDPYGDLLPESFLGRTRERGKVIGWAPQVAILAHPAVGGFLSHCGWSSTLETLWFRVPVATWPLFADHQLVASMLVKELGLAVEIRMDYQHAFKTKKGSILV
ncbi:UDP-glycosyltransferase 71E1-like [Chenopodium quinoa]|uniref:UDP-glycosyltransferase 71E1-like n=1 Tax=Chenopodium quinoa TaxID=63459 RepID=UPI000B77BB10|nr:UDP-glycosyltransferase 71E1-like [Chenopodium quinoa]